MDEYDGPSTPHTVIKMRLTFTDSYSDEVENTVDDVFNVIIMDKCTLNELTKNEALGVLLQYVTDPVSTDNYKLNYTPTENENSWPNCVITHTLEFWDEPKQLWIDYTTATTDYPYIQTWDPATGIFNLYTNDYVAYDDFSIIARVTAEDLYSEVEDKDKVTDQFEIQLRDECHDIQLHTSISLSDRASA